jgi:selenide,water dikinase
VGSATFDDAAVIRVNPDLALVQTLDFFTPIVDSPKRFGAIAAANALSDVYAMGGKPKTALAILAFPVASFEPQIVTEVLQGAIDVIEESGAALVGGHTIDDDTLKFGISATGYVHPDRIWSNAGAKSGDVLILTKPLGTGTLTAALKRGEVDEPGIQDALDSMCRLNNLIDDLSPGLAGDVHSATDITGFGLAGHAYNMAKASGVGLEFKVSSIPRFARAVEFIEKKFLTKAHRSNREYVEAVCGFDGISETEQLLLMDPQTSGGLLLAVDPKSASEILVRARERFKESQVVGRVLAAGAPALRWT